MSKAPDVEAEGELDAECELLFAESIIAFAQSEGVTEEEMKPLLQARELCKAACEVERLARVEANLKEARIERDRNRLFHVMNALKPRKQECNDKYGPMH